MSKLDDIFGGINLTDKHRRQIQELFLEIIGEDEIRPLKGPQRNGIAQGFRRARNKLRIELRQKVKEL
jgi:hypothetical protein